ncbi:TATA-box-binding protein-like [Saccostrea cucullata]|uniref:TATA-box-binding protein-like n=1 Tax=Saccostrea cuccullata TaxID=36930 RepID=UPI002ED601A5
MRLTNVVVQGKLDGKIDLRNVAKILTNVTYNPKSFSGLMWQHGKIGGACKLFKSGAIQCNGKSSSFHEGIERLRRYARFLQRKGLCTNVMDIRVVTASATHR